MSDRPGCSALFDGIPGCMASFCGIVGIVAGAVALSVVGFREVGVLAGILGIPLGALGGGIGAAVLVATLGAVYTTVGTLLDSGFSGVVSLWTPRTKIEWAAAILAGASVAPSLA